MSDIEVIEVVESHRVKRKLKDGKANGNNFKRKRTSSGLIEKSEIMKGTETQFEEFVIDRTITPQRKLRVKDLEDSADGNSASQWRKRVESTLLGFEPPPEDTKKARNNRYKKSCFNCDGEHNVFDCPLPKNHKRIAEKKRESGDEVRRRQQFYNTGITNQKQHNFKPGQLSDRLRYALGLEENDIPEHIYRMRRIGFIKGYPPGWLQKAIKSTDFVKFYTSEFGDDTEDNQKPLELDPSKLIWYPGFNDNDAKLNDLETFKIPPKNVFCESYQKELDNTHKKQKEVVKKMEKTQKAKAQHIKFIDDDDDDVVIIGEHQPGENEKFFIPGEEDSVLILDGKAEETKTKVPVTPHQKLVEMGDSMHQTIGTPVFANLPLADVPSLEAFSLGIQPFEARDEEVQSKGTFRKLMDSLNRYREDVEKNPDLEIIEISNPSESSTSSVICLSSSPSMKSRKKKKKKMKKFGNNS